MTSLHCVRVVTHAHTQSFLRSYLCIGPCRTSEGVLPLSSAPIRFQLYCVWTLGGKCETTGKTNGEPQSGRTKERTELHGKVEWISYLD